MSDREQVKMVLVLFVNQLDPKRKDRRLTFTSQMENRQATVVDHKLESRPQEGGKRKVTFNNKRSNKTLV